MIYESKYEGYGLTLPQGGSIRFQRKVWPLPGGIVVFGQFDTNDTKKSVNLSSEALCALIESSEMFQNRVVGKFGVWRQDERLKGEQSMMNSPLFESELRNLTDAELLTACAVLKIPLPIGPSRQDSIGAITAKKNTDGLTLVQVIKAAGQKVKAPQLEVPTIPVQEPDPVTVPPAPIPQPKKKRRGLETLASGSPQVEPK